MNRYFSVLAIALSACTLFLSFRSQQFSETLIDDHQVRSLSIGQGPISVVFESGFGSPLGVWSRVQPEVAEFASTISYDRAGTGLSEKSSIPRDGENIAIELRELLASSGLPPPYILVGHSLGGLYVRVFAGSFPDLVAGILLVDPTMNPEWAGRFGDSELPELASLRATIEQAEASLLSPNIRVVLIDALGQPQVPFASASIGREMTETQSSEVRQDSAEYSEWLQRIGHGELIATNSSGHNVPIEQPALIVNTIRRMAQFISD